MSMFNRAVKAVKEFFGVKQGAAWMTEQASGSEIQKHSPKDNKKRLSALEKLEKHYKSCGLKKWQLRDTSGMPILKSTGQPLHVYALNKINFTRKQNRVISGDKSIPTFA